MPRTLTQAYLDEDVGIDDETWYCVKYDPFHCKDCMAVQEFIHVMVEQNRTAIVVFPTKDHKVALDVAAHFMEKGKNPRIVRYHPDFGLSVSVDEVGRMTGL